MKKKKINSKIKGKRIELEFVNFLKERGFHAARSQQYCGKNGDADVNVEELQNFHFEVKGGQQVPAKIYKFMEQAVEDSQGEKCPIECWKSYEEEWSKKAKKVSTKPFKDFDVNTVLLNKPTIEVYIPYKHRNLCPVHAVSKKTPICVLKRDREDFLVVMRGEEWLNFHEPYLFDSQQPEIITTPQNKLKDNEDAAFNVPLRKALITKFMPGTIGKKEDYLVEDKTGYYGNVEERLKEKEKVEKQILEGKRKLLPSDGSSYSKEGDALFKAYSRGIVEESEEF